MTKKDASGSNKVTKHAAPVALGFDPITLGGAASGAKFLWDVSKETFTALKPDAPLEVCVEDSKTLDDVRVLQITVWNHGRHTVSIDGFVVANPPKNANLDLNIGASLKSNVSEQNFNNMSDEDLALDLQTIEIQSGKGVRLRLLILNLLETHRKKNPFLDIKIKYIVFGLSKKPKEHKFGVAIRL